MSHILQPGRSAAAPRVQRRGALAASAFVLAMLAAPSAATMQGALAIAPAAAPRHPYAQHVSEAAQRFGIPESWIAHVMHVESRGNPRAVSHAGAMGLMQIMPATWTMLSAPRPRLRPVRRAREYPRRCGLSARHVGSLPQHHLDARRL